MTATLHVLVVAIAWGVVTCFCRARRPGAPWTLPCAVGICSTAIALMTEAASADLGSVAMATLTQAWLALTAGAFIALVAAALVTERLLVRYAPVLAITGIGLQVGALLDGGRSAVALITLVTPVGPVVPTDLSRILVVIAAVGISAPAAGATGLGFARNPWRGRMAAAAAVLAGSMLLSIAAKDTSGVAITGIATLAFAHAVLDRPGITGGLVALGTGFSLIVFTQVRVANERLGRWFSVTAPGPVKQELAALFAASSGGNWGKNDLIGLRSLGPAWLSDYMPADILHFFGIWGGIILFLAAIVGGLGLLRASRIAPTRVGRNLAGTLGLTLVCHTIGAWAAALAALPETGIGSPFHTVSNTSLAGTSFAIGVAIAMFPMPSQPRRQRSSTATSGSAQRDLANLDF